MMLWIWVFVCGWKHHRGAVLDHMKMICLWPQTVAYCIGGKTFQNLIKKRNPVRESSQGGNVYILLKWSQEQHLKRHISFYMSRWMYTLEIPDYSQQMMVGLNDCKFFFSPVCPRHFFNISPPLTSTWPESHMIYESAAFIEHRLMVEVCWISLFIVYWLQA